LKDKRTSKNAMMTGDPADILPSNFSWRFLVERMIKH
jgi:hypothetical protein